MDMVKVVITAIPAKNIAAIGNTMKKLSISPPFLNAPGRIHLALFIVSDRPYCRRLPNPLQFILAIVSPEPKSLRLRPTAGSGQAQTNPNVKILVTIEAQILKRQDLTHQTPDFSGYLLYEVRLQTASIKDIISVF